jgi:hypothetical protein
LPKHPNVRQKVKEARGEVRKLDKEGRNMEGGKSPRREKSVEQTMEEERRE